LTASFGLPLSRRRATRGPIFLWRVRVAYATNGQRRPRRALSVTLAKPCGDGLLAMRA
jgi:hypothetical protein